MRIRGELFTGEIHGGLLDLNEGHMTAVQPGSDN